MPGGFDFEKGPGSKTKVSMALQSEMESNDATFAIQRDESECTSEDEGAEQVDLTPWRSADSATGYRAVYQLPNGKFQTRYMQSYSTAEAAARAVARRWVELHGAPPRPGEDEPGFEAPQLVRGRAAKQKPAGALNSEPVSAEAMSERQQMAYLMKLTAMEPAASQLEQVGEAGRAKKRSRPARSEADKPDAGQKRGGTQERLDNEQYSLEQYGSRECKIGQYSQEAVKQATKPKGGSWDEMLGRLREWQVG